VHRLYDASYYNTPPLILSALDTALLSELTPTLPPITPSFTLLPMNKTSDGDDGPSLPSTLRLILTPLLFSIASILFTLPAVVHLVAEREQFCKHQQLLMGMDITACTPPPHPHTLVCAPRPHTIARASSRFARADWLGTFLFHSGLLLAVLALPAIIAAAAASAISAAAFPAFVLATLLSLPSIMLFGFLFSFIFSKKETAASFYMVGMIMVSAHDSHAVARTLHCMRALSSHSGVRCVCVAGLHHLHDRHFGPH
jgi:hypothetical protein